MNSKTLLTPLIVLLAAGTAAAQSKGGKVPWETDPQAAMESAKKRGRAMMLYFTTDG